MADFQKKTLKLSNLGSVVIVGIPLLKIIKMDVINVGILGAKNPWDMKILENQ
jgi:hypothetical protein